MNPQPYAEEVCLPANPQRVRRALRVALVVEAAGGGVAVHLVDLIRGLAADGVEVHLIAPLGERFDTSILTAEATAPCASVTRVPMQRSVSWRDLIAFVHVYRALSRIKPDVVHAHSSKAGVLARLSFGPWRTLYTPHAVYTLNPYLEPGARRFYGSIEGLFGRWLNERVIAVSDDEARHLQRDLRIPGERIKTIYNGVPSFAQAGRDVARKVLGLRSDAFVVGVVGRLEFQKGIDRLVQLAQRLQRSVGDELQFALIGAGRYRGGRGHAGRPAAVESVLCRPRRRCATLLRRVRCVRAAEPLRRLSVRLSRSDGGRAAYRHDARRGRRYVGCERADRSRRRK